MSSLTVAVIAAFASISLVQGATILSENFNELTPALAVTSAGAFTTTGGTNVDIVGAANGFGALCAAPESGNCIDLDGSGGLSQGILASGPITLDPGTSYFLSYDLIGSGRGSSASATVTFGPYSHSFTLASGDTSTGIVTNALITVAATTTTSLVFTSNTPGNIGDVLDNVSITTSPASTVPEPSSAMLVIPVLIGLGLFVRRRLVRQTRPA